MPAVTRALVLASLVVVGCAPAPVSSPPAAPAPTAVAAPAAPHAPAVDPQAELAAKIDPIFADFVKPGSPSPGCAVGVYRAGEIVFSKGYGSADLEHDAPITDTTPFYTASLSKQFTAAAVLLLVADGKLALDDDVHKYVPELPAFGGARITIDDLLHHTSGLRDYHLLLLLEGLDEEDVITRREILWLLAHQRTLGFSPGARFSYSSSGYVLLAEIVTRATGETFGAFLAHRVLEPLEMNASLVREDHARVIPHRAIGYTHGHDGQPRSFMGNLEYDGSSNFVTTIRDLARWDANFYDPRVGGPALIEAMRARGRLTDGTVIEYARGIDEWETHGVPLEWHDGGFAGYRSALYRYPTERLTIAVLCNTTEADSNKLADQVSAVFLPQLGTPAPPPVAPTPVSTAAFGTDFAAVAGTYVDLGTAETRTLDPTGGVLHMRYGGTSHPPKKLVPVGVGDLLLEGGRTHYRYEAPKGTQPAQLVRIVRGQYSVPFVRAEHVDDVPVAKLAEYTGRFGSDELAHDLDIRIEDGHLFAATVGGARRTAPFTPVARDLFVTPDVGWDSVGWRFERDPRGNVIRLVASTERARNVTLVKR
jgi:CubicO group peptidase (beta-lactamase class C family)